MRAAEIDHRLYREKHTGFEHDAFPGPPDVHDIRLVMKQTAKTMTAEITYHAHMLSFDIGLDRVADVAACCAGPDRGNAAHHRLMGDVDQTLGAAWDFADREHAA